MDHNHSFLKVLSVAGTVAALALPIAVSTYAGQHVSSVNLPMMNSSVSAAFSATPISDLKAKAVKEFKLLQA